MPSGALRSVLVADLAEQLPAIADVVLGLHTERRLAVYQLTGQGTNVVDPAARSFAGGA